MTDSQIRVDGGGAGPEGDTPPPVPSTLSPVFTGVAGIAIGLMIALALNGPGPVNEDAQSPATAGTAVADPVDIPTSTVTTIAPPGDPSLLELVPGLENGLVGFGFDPAGNAVIAEWNADKSEPGVTSLPWGFVESDASGTWIAIDATQRYSTGRTLWVGNPAYVEAVTLSAQSYAWSSLIRGDIAFIENAVIDGETQPRLITRTLTGDPVSGTRLEVPVPFGSEVVWYGATQITVGVPANQGTRQQLLRVSLDGTVESTIGIDEFIAATDTFGLVKIDGEYQYIDSDHNSLGAFALPTAGCSWGSFSPANIDQRKLALSCVLEDGTSGIKVWALDPNDLSATDLGFQPVLSLTAFSWDTTGRFVITTAPADTGRPESIVTMFDTETTETFSLRWPGSLFQVESVRR